MAGVVRAGAKSRDLTDVALVARRERGAAAATNPTTLLKALGQLASRLSEDEGEEEDQGRSKRRGEPASPPSPLGRMSAAVLEAYPPAAAEQQAPAPAPLPSLSSPQAQQASLFASNAAVPAGGPSAADVVAGSVVQAMPAAAKPRLGDVSPAGSPMNDAMQAQRTPAEQQRVDSRALGNRSLGNLAHDFHQAGDYLRNDTLHDVGSIVSLAQHIDNDLYRGKGPSTGSIAAGINVLGQLTDNPSVQKVGHVVAGVDQTLKAFKSGDTASASIAAGQLASTVTGSKELGAAVQIAGGVRQLVNTNGVLTNGMNGAAALAGGVGALVGGKTGETIGKAADVVRNVASGLGTKVAGGATSPYVAAAAGIVGLISKDPKVQAGASAVAGVASALAGGPVVSVVAGVAAAVMGIVKLFEPNRGKMGDAAQDTYADINNDGIFDKVYRDNDNDIKVRHGAQDKVALTLDETTLGAAWDRGNRLAVNQMLGPGQTMTSANGRFEAQMQQDGNLVVRDKQVPPGEQPKVIWQSNTAGFQASSLLMQGDGNLVTYRPSPEQGKFYAAWNTGVAPPPPAPQRVWVATSGPNAGQAIAYADDPKDAALADGATKTIRQDITSEGGRTGARTAGVEVQAQLVQPNGRFWVYDDKQGERSGKVVLNMPPPDAAVADGATQDRAETFTHSEGSDTAQVRIRAATLTPTPPPSNDFSLVLQDDGVLAVHRGQAGPDSRVWSSAASSGQVVMPNFSDVVQKINNKGLFDRPGQRSEMEVKDFDRDGFADLRWKGDVSLNDGTGKFGRKVTVAEAEASAKQREDERAAQAARDQRSAQNQIVDLTGNGIADFVRRDPQSDNAFEIEQGTRTPETIALNSLTTSDATALGSEFAAGQVLLPGQGIYSDNKRFLAQMEANGNLVVYDRQGATDTVPPKAIWQSGVTDKPGSVLRLNADGNLMSYQATSERGQFYGSWNSATPLADANGEVFLKMQDDGNLTVNRGTGGADNRGAVWGSMQSAGAVMQPTGNGVKQRFEDATPFDEAQAGRKTLMVGDFRGVGLNDVVFKNKLYVNDGTGQFTNVIDLGGPQAQAQGAQPQSQPNQAASFSGAALGAGTARPGAPEPERPGYQPYVAPVLTGGRPETLKQPAPAEETPDGKPSSIDAKGPRVFGEGPRINPNGDQALIDGAQSFDPNSYSYGSGAALDTDDPALRPKIEEHRKAVEQFNADLDAFNKRVGSLPPSLVPPDAQKQLLAQQQSLQERRQQIESQATELDYLIKGSGQPPAAGSRGQRLSVSSDITVKPFDASDAAASIERFSDFADPGAGDFKATGLAKFEIGNGGGSRVVAPVAKVVERNDANGAGHHDAMRRGVANAHTGWDLAGKAGDEIVSPVAGKVLWSGTSDDYGEMVAVFDAQRKQVHILAHLQSRDLKTGDTVEAGGAVGKMGRTGNIHDGTKTHVHWEVRDVGTVAKLGDGFDPVTHKALGADLDPEKWMAQHKGHASGGGGSSGAPKLFALEPDNVDSAFRTPDLIGSTGDVAATNAAAPRADTSAPDGTAVGGRASAGAPLSWDLAQKLSRGEFSWLTVPGGKRVQVMDTVDPSTGKEARLVVDSGRVNSYAKGTKLESISARHGTGGEYAQISNAVTQQMVNKTLYDAKSPIYADVPQDLRQPIIDNALRFQVDPRQIIAIVWQESRFRRDIIDGRTDSPAGARGPMQVMPDTAAGMGHSVARLTGPSGITAGTQYLADMLAQSNGDFRIAAARYNAGPGAVDKHGGVPPYMETQDYVQGTGDKYRELVAKSNSYIDQLSGGGGSLARSDANAKPTGGAPGIGLSSQTFEVLQGDKASQNLQSFAGGSNLFDADRIDEATSFSTTTIPGASTLIATQQSLADGDRLAKLNQGLSSKGLPQGEVSGTTAIRVPPDAKNPKGQEIQVPVVQLADGRTAVVVADALGNVYRTGQGSNVAQATANLQMQIDGDHNKVQHARIEAAENQKKYLATAAKAGLPGREIKGSFTIQNPADPKDNDKRIEVPMLAGTRSNQAPFSAMYEFRSGDQTLSIVTAQGKTAEEVAVKLSRQVQQRYDMYAAGFASKKEQTDYSRMLADNGLGKSRINGFVKIPRDVVNGGGEQVPMRVVKNAGSASSTYSVPVQVGGNRVFVGNGATPDQARDDVVAKMRNTFLAEAEQARAQAQADAQAAAEAEAAREQAAAESEAAQARAPAEGSEQGGKPSRSFTSILSGGAVDVPAKPTSIAGSILGYEPSSVSRKPRSITETFSPGATDAGSSGSGSSGTLFSFVPKNQFLTKEAAQPLPNLDSSRGAFGLPSLSTPTPPLKASDPLGSSQPSYDFNSTDKLMFSGARPAVSISTPLFGTIETPQLNPVTETKFVSGGAGLEVPVTVPTALRPGESAPPAQNPIKQFTDFVGNAGNQLAESPAGRPVMSLINWTQRTSDAVANSPVGQNVSRGLGWLGDKAQSFSQVLNYPWTPTDSGSAAPGGNRPAGPIQIPRRFEANAFDTVQAEQTPAGFLRASVPAFDGKEITAVGKDQRELTENLDMARYTYEAPLLKEDPLGPGGSGRPDAARTQAIEEAEAIAKAQAVIGNLRANGWLPPDAQINDLGKGASSVDFNSGSGPSLGRASSRQQGLFDEIVNPEPQFDSSPFKSAESVWQGTSPINDGAATTRATTGAGHTASAADALLSDGFIKALSDFGSVRNPFDGAKRVGQITVPLNQALPGGAGENVAFNVYEYADRQQDRFAAQTYGDDGKTKIVTASTKDELLYVLKENVERQQVREQLAEIDAQRIAANPPDISTRIGSGMVGPVLGLLEPVAGLLKMGGSRDLSDSLKWAQDNARIQQQQLGVRDDDWLRRSAELVTTGVTAYGSSLLTFGGLANAQRALNLPNWARVGITAAGLPTYSTVTRDAHNGQPTDWGKLGASIAINTPFESLWPNSALAQAVTGTVGDITVDYMRTGKLPTAYEAALNLTAEYAGEKGGDRAYEAVTGEKVPALLGRRDTSRTGVFGRIGDQLGRQQTSMPTPSTADGLATLAPDASTASNAEPNALQREVPPGDTLLVTPEDPRPSERMNVGAPLAPKDSFTIRRVPPSQTATQVERTALSGDVAFDTPTDPSAALGTVARRLTNLQPETQRIVPSVDDPLQGRPAPPAAGPATPVDTAGKVSRRDGPNPQPGGSSVLPPKAREGIAGDNRAIALKPGDAAAPTLIAPVASADGTLLGEPVQEVDLQVGEKYFVQLSSVPGRQPELGVVRDGEVAASLRNGADGARDRYDALFGARSSTREVIAPLNPTFETETGYFLHSDAVSEGSVTVNADGSLTLDPRSSLNERTRFVGGELRIPDSKDPTVLDPVSALAMARSLSAATGREVVLKGIAGGEQPATTSGTGAQDGPQPTSSDAMPSGATAGSASFTPPLFAGAGTQSEATPESVSESPDQTSPFLSLHRQFRSTGTDLTQRGRDEIGAGFDTLRGQARLTVGDYLVAAGNVARARHNMSRGIDAALADRTSDPTYVAVADQLIASTDETPWPVRNWRDMSAYLGTKFDLLGKYGGVAHIFNQLQTAMEKIRRDPAETVTATEIFEADVPDFGQRSAQVANALSGIQTLDDLRQFVEEPPTASMEVPGSLTAEDVATTSNAERYADIVARVRDALSEGAAERVTDLKGEVQQFFNDVTPAYTQEMAFEERLRSYALMSLLSERAGSLSEVNTQTVLPTGDEVRERMQSIETGREAPVIKLSYNPLHTIQPSAEELLGTRSAGASSNDSATAANTAPPVESRSDIDIRSSSLYTIDSLNRSGNNIVGSSDEPGRQPEVKLMSGFSVSETLQPSRAYEVEGSTRLAVPIDVLVQGPTANVAAQIVIHAAGENQATATFEPSGDHLTDAQVRSALVQIARREGQTALTVNGESVVASPAQSTVSKRGAGQEPLRAVSVEPSQAGDRTIDVSLLTAAERRFLRGRQSRGLSGIDVDNIARKLGVSVSELFSPAVRAAIGTFDAQREERRGAMVEQLGDVDEFIARVEETPRLRAGDRLPPETDEQILRGLAEGKSLREIASELGISDTTVGTRLDVLGNAYQPSDRQLLSTEGRDADILRARARGQTLEQIAFDSVSTVSDVRRVVRGAMAEDHPLIVNPDGTERPPTQTVEQYIAARQALAREAEQIAEQMAAANPDIVVYVWLQAGRGKVAEEVGKTLGVSKFDTRRLLREAIELYGKPEALVDDGTRTAVRSAMDAIRSAVMHRSPPQRIPLLRSAINELSASGVAPDLAESLQRMFDQDPAELAQVVRLARLNEPGSAVNDKFKMDESGWRELADRLLEKLSEEQVSDLLSPLRRANAGSTGTEPDTTGWSSNTDSQTRVDRFDTRLLNRWFAEPINGTNGQQQYNNFLDFAQQRGLADELAEVGHAPTLDPSGSDGQPNPDANVNRALLTAVLDLRRDRSKAAKDLFKSLPVQVQEFADIVINANAPQANGEASPRKSYLARSFRPQQVDPGTLADALPSSGQLLVETGIAALDEYKPDARGTHFPTEMLLQLKFSQKTEEVNRAADYFARLLQRALGPAEQANARGVELVPVPSSTPGSLTSTLRVLTRLNMLQKQAGKPAYKIRPLIVNPFGRPSVRSGPGNAATKQQDHQLLRGATNPDKVYVLIDDVVTTGGTITAAMQAMLQNSADKSRPIKVAPLGLTMTRRLSGPQAERLIDGARRGRSSLGEVVKSVVKPADVERMARDPDYFAGQDEKIVRRFAAVRDLREYMGNYGLLEVDVDVPTLQTDLSTGRSAPGDDLIQPQSSSRAGTGNSNVDAAAQNPKELAEQLANGTLPLEEIEHALRKTFSYLDDQQATQIARAAHDDHITAAGNAADAYTTIDRLLKSGSQDASAYERAVDDITGAAISSGTRLASAIGEVLVKLALDERLPKNWRQRAADQAAKAGYDVKVPQDARDTFSYGALSPDFEQRYQLELKKNPTTPNRTAVELLKATGAQGNPKLLVLEPKGIAENLLNHPVASRLRGAVPTVGPDEVGGSHALHVLSQASATPVELSLHTAGDIDPVIGPASQAGVVNASFSWLGSQNQVALETAVSSTPNVVWVLPVHNLNDGDAAKTELVIRFEKFMRRLDENGKLANATPSQLREARQQALKAINATEAELTAAVKVYEERVEYLRNTTALLKYPNVMIVSGADAAGNPSTVGEVDGVFTDVAGPGEDVVAAADPASGKLWASGFDGLSLSSPYVAQYLAVAKAFGGRLPPKELIRLARDTADKSDAFIGLNVAGGTLNPDAFLRAAAVAETVLKTTGVTIDRAAEQLGVQLTEAERRSVQGAVDRTRDPSLEPRIEFGRQQTEEPASISFTPLKYASSSGSSGSAMAPQTMGGPGRSESGGDADAGWLPVSVPGVDGEAQYKILWESPAIDPRSRNAFVPVDIRFRSDQGREMTARLLASLDTERPRAGKVEALTWSGDSRDDAAFFRVITKVAEHQRGITQDSLTMTAPNGTTFIARREDQSWVNASPTMPGPQSSDAAAQLAAAIRDLRRYLQSKTPTPSQSLPGEGVTERPTPPSRPIPPPNFLARRTYSIAASSAVGSDLSPGQARRVGRRQLVTTSVLDNGLLRTTYGPDLISGKALKSLAGLVSAREAFLQEALKGRYVVVANRQSGQDTSPVAAISMELDPSGNGPAVVRVVHGSGQVIEDLLKSAVRAADEGGVRIVEVRGPTSTDNDGLLTSMDLTEEEQRAQYGLSNVQHSQLSFVPYDGNTVAEQMLNEAHLAGKAVSESVESILETVAQGRSRSNAARQRAHESATDFLHQLLAVKTQAVGVGAGQSMQWMLDAVESMVSALHPDNGDGRWRYGRQSGVNNARTLYHVQGFIDSLMHDLGTMVGQDGALERFNANRNPAVENASVAPRNLEFAVENTTDRTVRQQFEPLFRDIVSGKYDQYIPVHRRAGQELRTGMDPKSPYTTYDGKQPAQLVWADPRRREIIFDDLFFRAGIPLNDASPINRELGRLARRELFGADNENVENPLARRIYEIVVKTGRSSIAADTMRPSIGTELESYFQDTGVLTLSNGQRYDANPKRGQRDRGILHRDQPEAIYESGYGMLVHVLQLANVTRREISKWFGGVGSSSTVASPKGLTTERLANFLLEISSLWLPNKVNKGPVFALVQALAELSERNQADRREARRARELLQEAEDDPDTFNRVYFWRELGRRPESEVEAALKDAGAALSEKVAVTVRVVNDILREISKKVKPLYDIKYAALDNVPTLTFYRNAYVKNMTPDRMTALDPTIKAAEQARITIRTLVPAFVAIATAIGSYFAQRNQQSILNRLPPAKDPTKRPAITSTPAPTDQRIADLQSERSKLPSKLEDARSRATAGATELDILSGDYSGIKAVQDFNARTKASVENLDRQIAAVKLELQAREADIQRRHGNEGATTPEQNELNRRRDQLEALTTLRGETAAQPAKLINELNEVRRQLVQRRQSELQSKLNELRSDQEDRLQQIDTSIAEARNALSDAQQTIALWTQSQQDARDRVSNLVNIAGAQVSLANAVEQDDKTGVWRLSQDGKDALNQIVLDALKPDNAKIVAGQTRQRVLSAASGLYSVQADPQNPGRKTLVIADELGSGPTARQKEQAQATFLDLQRRDRELQSQKTALTAAFRAEREALVRQYAIPEVKPEPAPQPNPQQKSRKTSSAASGNQDVASVAPEQPAAPPEWSQAGSSASESGGEPAASLKGLSPGDAAAVSKNIDLLKELAAKTKDAGPVTDAELAELIDIFSTAEEEAIANGTLTTDRFISDSNPTGVVNMAMSGSGSGQSPLDAQIQDHPEFATAQVLSADGGDPVRARMRALQERYGVQWRLQDNDIEYRVGDGEFRSAISLLTRERLQEMSAGGDTGQQGLVSLQLRIHGVDLSALEDNLFRQVIADQGERLWADARQQAGQTSLTDDELLRRLLNDEPSQRALQALQNRGRTIDIQSPSGIVVSDGVSSVDLLDPSYTYMLFGHEPHYLALLKANLELQAERTAPVADGVAQTQASQGLMAEALSRSPEVQRAFGNLRSVRYANGDSLLVNELGVLGAVGVGTPIRQAAVRSARGDREGALDQLATSVADELENWRRSIATRRQRDTDVSYLINDPQTPELSDALKHVGRKLGVEPVLLESEIVFKRKDDREPVFELSDALVLRIATAKARGEVGRQRTALAQAIRAELDAFIRDRLPAVLDEEGRYWMQSPRDSRAPDAIWDMNKAQPQALSAEDVYGLINQVRLDATSGSSPLPYHGDLRVELVGPTLGEPIQLLVSSHGHRRGDVTVVDESSFEVLPSFSVDALREVLSRHGNPDQLRVRASTQRYPSEIEGSEDLQGRQNQGSGGANATISVNPFVGSGFIEDQLRSNDIAPPLRDDMRPGGWHFVSDGMPRNGQPPPLPDGSLPLPDVRPPRPSNQRSAPPSGDPPITVLPDGLGTGLRKGVEEGVEPLLSEVNDSVADTPGAWQPQSRLSRLVNKLDGGGGAAQKKR